MNTEIKTQEKENGNEKYSFEATVKETEKTMLKALKLIKQSPPPTIVLADERGIGFTLLPEVNGMSNGEVMSKMGSALAHSGKQVKTVGIVCEAYMSKRTDIAPSKDPKAKEVLFMAFADDAGKQVVNMYTHKKGKTTKMKGMDGTHFKGLTDEFWAGYRTPPPVSSEVKPTMC